MARKSERSRGADGADGGGDGAGAMADDGRPPRTTKKGEGDPDSGETTPMPDDGPAHKLSKAPSRARSHQSHRSHKSHRSVVAAMTAADMAAAANQIGGFHAVAVGADPAKGDEEDAALAVQSGAAIEMENFALDAIEEETEDAAHLMDQETAADKARKFKRVHASLTAETFWRPFRALRLAIRGVIAIVLVVHGLCFGLLMAWTSEQKSLTKLLLRSGDVVHEVLLVKVYARLLQMHGAGSHVGPRAEEEIRFELAHAAQVFMEEFTEISSASGGCMPGSLSIRERAEAAGATSGIVSYVDETPRGWHAQVSPALDSPIPHVWPRNPTAAALRPARRVAPTIRCSESLAQGVWRRHTETRSSPFTATSTSPSRCPSRPWEGRPRSGRCHTGTSATPLPRRGWGLLRHRGTSWGSWRTTTTSGSSS